MARANARDIRVVEVTASTQHNTVWLYCRTWSHQGTALRQAQTTRVVKMVMPLQVTDEELLKLAAVMANFCTDPGRRHLRPPKALVWREMATGDVMTQEHGEERDSRHMPMDPLPLEGGFTSEPTATIIPIAPEARRVGRAKRVRSDPKAPTVRSLKTGKQSQLDGA